MTDTTTASATSGITASATSGIDLGTLQDAIVVRMDFPDRERYIVRGAAWEPCQPGYNPRLMLVLERQGGLLSGRITVKPHAEGFKRVYG